MPAIIRAIMAAPAEARFRNFLRRAKKAAPQHGSPPVSALLYKARQLPRVVGERDVQVFELLFRHRARRLRHEVLPALGLGEGVDVA